MGITDDNLSEFVILYREHCEVSSNSNDDHLQYHCIGHIGCSGKFAVPDGGGFVAEFLEVY